MSDKQLDRPHLSDSPDVDETSYRAVSASAVAALLLGLASPAALFGPPLWFIPVAALALSLIALRAIAAEPSTVIGRKAALIGLALSLVIGIACPVDWLVYRWQIRREAERFGLQWFEFLRNNEPHKAFQLTSAPNDRAPLDDSLWQTYYEGSDSRRFLEEFINRKMTRALLALGEDAKVRYYDTEEQESSKTEDSVTQTFAVSYTPPGESTPTTFFVSLRMLRTQPKDSDRAFWQITNSEGGVTPRAFGGSGRPGA
ncbi:MAG: hypothetical protein NUV77_19955 [Thermoguttaceae bacterium]|jgi:hypothetical protein|nr:hypothetical protein [Thermoguttaceae bacterium]